MKRHPLQLTLAALALSVAALSGAATTPEGALKDFLTAAKKKDRTVIRQAIDWDALGKGMGYDEEKDPGKRKTLMDTMRVVYVESFAMGKAADGLKVGKVEKTKKGDEAKGVLMRTDPKTKKTTPATEFTLHKVGKNWLITNITSARTQPEAK